MICQCCVHKLSVVPLPPKKKKYKYKIKEIKKNIAGFRSCVICYESFDLLGESGEE